MKITKIKKTGKWRIDVEPVKNRRFRKTCNTKTECMEYYRQLMEELQAEEQAEDDIDRRKLSELIDLWYEGTGRELSDNIRTKRILESFVKVIGDIEARKLTISHFNQYKKEKREEQYQGRTITDNTLNKHLGYLSRVYNYLIEIEEIDYKNPLRKLRMIKLDERELTFLTLNQVERVIAQKVLV